MAIPNRQLKPEILAARESAMQALKLRRAGASFQAISEQLGFADESGARKAVKALMGKYEYESVVEARKFDLERLDQMLLGTGKGGLLQLAIAGNFGAIDRVLRVMERRAKLLGLDAPTRQELKVDLSKLSDDELRALAEG